MDGYKTCIRQRYEYNMFQVKKLSKRKNGKIMKNYSEDESRQYHIQVAKGEV